MRNKAERCIAIILVILLIMAQGTSMASSDPYEAYDHYSMVIAHLYGQGTPQEESLQRYAALVDRETNGHVQVTVISRKEDASSETLMRELLQGEIQGMRGNKLEYVWQFQILTLPFLTNSGADIARLLDSDIAERLCLEAGEATGTAILSVGHGGYLQLFGNTREVYADDLEGMTMEYAGMRTSMTTVEALGGTAVRTDRIQTLSFDGALISCEDALNMDKVPGYAVDLNIQFQPDPFIVNLGWYQRLPQEFQRILKQCAEECDRQNVSAVEEFRNTAMEELQKRGCTVVSPLEEEAEECRDACLYVYQWIVNEGMTSEEEVSELKGFFR